MRSLVRGKRRSRRFLRSRFVCFGVHRDHMAVARACVAPPRDAGATYNSGSPPRRSCRSAGRDYRARSVTTRVAPIAADQAPTSVRAANVPSNVGA
jgi:hypothetical protein